MHLVRRHAVREQIQLLLFDTILHLPARTIPLLVELAPRPLLKRNLNERGKSYLKDVRRILSKIQAITERHRSGPDPPLRISRRKEKTGHIRSTSKGN